MNRAAIVVIGRNEGDRLKRCLQSLPADTNCIYVDSGSVDGSAEYALDLGISTIALDAITPFTAARARNAGLSYIKANNSAPEFVQMLDGDCVLHPDWIGQGTAALDKDPRLAAVFGRLRERDMDGSIYNRLCDAEWNVATGIVDASGGNVLFRLAALFEVGPYREEIIAGEEPDLCLRLGQRNWKIARILPDMAEHDAAITSIRQWWLRAVRAGHAYTEHVWIHRSQAFRSWKVQLLRILFWGIAMPIAALGAVVGMTLHYIAGTAMLALILMLYMFQFSRLLWRNRNGGYSWPEASKVAGLTLLGKLAEARGAMKFILRKIFRDAPRIIEYKSPMA